MRLRCGPSKAPAIYAQYIHLDKQGKGAILLQMKTILLKVMLVFEQKPPSVSYLSVLQCHFHNGQSCDFSNQPRPFYIFSIIQSGTATFSGSSGTAILGPGDVFFIPLGETYIAEWHGPGDLCCTSLFFIFGSNRNPLGGRKYPLQKLPETFGADLKKLFDEVACESGEREFFSFAAVSSFYTMCALIFKNLIYQKESDDTTVIKPALNYLEKNFSMAVSVKELAKLCQLSESRFYHIFKNRMGVSPIRYKNNLAVAHAEVYLQCNSRCTIEEISEKCGFSSAIYFRKVFKQHTGKSPTTFKKQTLL